MKAFFQRNVLVVISHEAVPGNSISALLNTLPVGTQLANLSEFGLRALSGGVEPAVREHRVERYIPQIIEKEDRFLSDRLTISVESDSRYLVSRLSELNFASGIWKAYLTMRCLEAAAAELGLSKLRYIGRNDLLFELLCSSGQLGCSHQSVALRDLRPKKETETRVNSVRKWAKNLFTELIAVGLSRAMFRSTIPAPPAITTYAGYSRNWHFGQDETPRYRFTGGRLLTQRYLHGIDRYEETFLISVTRQNEQTLAAPLEVIRRIIRLRRYRNAVILESFTTCRDLVHAYVIGVLRKPKPFGFDFLGGNRVKSSLMRILRWIDKPVLTTTRLTAARAANLLQGENIVVPIFELSEARQVVVAFNRSGWRTFGLQHGHTGILHFPRFITSIQALRRACPSAVPGAILTEGNFIRLSFSRRGLRATSIGAPRINKNLTVVHEHSARDESVTLVMLDMHSWRPVLRSLVMLARANPEMRFIARPHPSRIDLVRNDIAQAAVPNLVCDKVGELHHSLRFNRPHAIYAGPTGAVVELWRSKYPCATFSVPGILPNVPAEFLGRRHWLKRLMANLRQAYDAGYAALSSQDIEELSELAKEDIMTIGDPARQNLLEAVQRPYD